MDNEPMTPQEEALQALEDANACMTALALELINDDHPDQIRESVVSAWQYLGEIYKAVTPSRCGVCGFGNVEIVPARYCDHCKVVETL